MVAAGAISVQAQSSADRVNLQTATNAELQRVLSDLQNEVNSLSQRVSADDDASAGSGDRTAEIRDDGADQNRDQGGQSGGLQLDQILDTGSRGEQVRCVQKLLSQHSDLYSSGLVTGYYGDLTAEAVNRLQGEAGLPQVGRVGQQTLDYLQEISEPVNAPANCGVGQSGDEGDDGSDDTNSGQSSESGQYDDSIILAFTAGSINEFPILLGDVDYDGSVTNADARQIGQFISGNTPFSSQQRAAADVNGDGKVSGKDANMITAYASSGTGRGPALDAFPVTLGDVNQDGSVTDQDAILVQDYVRGDAGFSTTQKAAADVNGDGEITADVDARDRDRGDDNNDNGRDRDRDDDSDDNGRDRDRGDEGDDDRDDGDSESSDDRETVTLADTYRSFTFTAQLSELRDGVWEYTITGSVPSPNYNVDVQTDGTDIVAVVSQGQGAAPQVVTSVRKRGRFSTDGSIAANEFELTVRADGSTDDGNGDDGNDDNDGNDDGGGDTGNQPPEAEDDSYAVTAGDRVKISSPQEGVLANDTDPDDDTLEVENPGNVNRISNESGARSSFAADGTFTVRVDDDYTSETVEYRYRVTDGETSDSTRIVIEVRENESNSELEINLSPRRDDGEVGARADWESVEGADDYRTTIFRRDIYGQAENTRMVNSGTDLATGMFRSRAEDQGYCYYFRITVQAVENGDPLAGTKDTKDICVMANESNEPGTPPSEYSPEPGNSDAQMILDQTVGEVDEFPAEEVLFGDVNQDGTITAGDASLVQDYVAGDADLTFRQKTAADVDGDGEVTADEDEPSGTPTNPDLPSEVPTLPSPNVLPGGVPIR